MDTSAGQPSLVVEFRKSTMECMLDGFLYSNLTAQTQVILEAKATRHRNNAPEGPDKEPLRALLVSQHGDELYIAAAVPNDQYQEFLLDKQEPSNEEVFLRIKQWGPWDINKRTHVEDFARMILTVVLQARAEEVPAQDQDNSS